MYLSIVFWIQHHTCPTNVTVVNSLPIELNITNMVSCQDFSHISFGKVLLKLQFELNLDIEGIV